MLTEKARQKIADAITETNSEAFLVDIRLTNGGQRLLNIKVDTDKGISLAECAKISRNIGRTLELDSEFDFRYLLEVSSPGIGYPLKLHRQYIQNIGRYLRVVMTDHTDAKGKLAEVTSDWIVLEPPPVKRKKKKKKGTLKKAEPAEEPTDRKILFTEIKESKVIII